MEEEISKHELKERSKDLIKWRPFTDELVETVHWGKGAVRVDFFFFFFFHF